MSDSKTGYRESYFLALRRICFIFFDLKVFKLRLNPKKLTRAPSSPSIRELKIFSRNPLGFWFFTTVPSERTPDCPEATFSLEEA